MSLQTLNDTFFSIVGRKQPDLMLRNTAEGWAPISSDEFVSKVKGVATALRSWGISRGDRVAILSENRHEWVVADFACLLLGAAVVPIYQKHLTKGDIDALVAFYSSPTGQKMLRELPAIMAETMQAMMPSIEKYMETVRQRIDEQFAQALKQSEKKSN